MAAGPVRVFMTRAQAEAVRRAFGLVTLDDIELDGAKERIDAALDAADDGYPFSIEDLLLRQVELLETMQIEADQHHQQMRTIFEFPVPVKIAEGSRG